MNDAPVRPTSAEPAENVRSSPAAGTFSRPRPLLPWVTYLVLLPLIALATIVFGCVSLACGIWDHTGKQQHAVARAWARVLLKISLSPIKVVGREHLASQPVAVYVSNHLSYFDTPVLFAKLPFQFRILAKQSLWKTPFIGWYLNRSGQVPIDSNSGRSAIAGLLRGVKTLNAGLPLVLFPEGGRSPDGNLTPFQSGAAFMAIKAQVPIVPLAIVGTYELLPMHTYHLTPRPMMIVAGPAIATTGLTTRDTETVTAQIFAAIQDLYLSHASDQL